MKPCRSGAPPMDRNLRLHNSQNRKDGPLVLICTSQTLRIFETHSARSFDASFGLPVTIMEIALRRTGMEYADNNGKFSLEARITTTT